MKKIIISLLIGVFAASSEASVIELDFATLPSAQGWTYFAGPGTPAPESTVFSVDGTSLYQSTIGLPTTGAGGNRYEYRGAVDPLLPYELDVRTRLLAEEIGAGDPFNHYGFTLGILSGTEAVAIGLGASVFSTNDSYPTEEAYPSGGFDVTEFHDYRIVGTPGVSYDFFIDGVLVYSGTPFVANVGNYLILGDGTGDTNAAAEVSFYRFAQVVPIPATVWLFSSALGFICWMGRKKA